MYKRQDYESAIAIVHSRFSTNTNPSWERAHPNRFIVHNGEINTIRGNADKMLAREETMRAPAFLADDLTKVLPVVNTGNCGLIVLVLKVCKMCIRDRQKAKPGTALAY